MANIISYPLYYTSYYTPSSGIVNLTGFIFHETTESDNYYFPLPLTFELTQLIYLPINIDAEYTTDCAKTLGFYYYSNYSIVTKLKDIPLNIGTNVLDICYSNCYLLVCTNLGVECLNGRTFKSIWYFNSTIVSSTRSNQNIVCFGTTYSGIYYNYFPTTTGTLGGNFFGSCKQVNNLISNKITSICTTSGGFFVGEDGGVDVLTTSNSGLDLKVTCQLTCSGVSVAYSYDTETYYWSTANTVYCADTCT